MGAASPLNVSRPYLIKLLDVDGVMAYKQRSDASWEDVLAQLTADALENDMGYAHP